MPRQAGSWEAFDPEFDDTQWTDGWLQVPIAQVPPGAHASGYRVERQMLEYTEVFGHPMRLTQPLECRLLYDPQGRLWMSDTPQERIMMYNNSLRTKGAVLVGGLGLGLYLQYAATGAIGRATRFTVIERSPVIVDIVEPTVSVSLPVPLEIRLGDVLSQLSGPPSERYDTIFLDTWETLDAAHLPTINFMRDRAIQHLAPGGQVLLWGYRWMVRLFEDACRQVLAIVPQERRGWLLAQVETSPKAVALLMPVVARFDGQVIDDLETALEWCRRFITSYSLPVS
jgi:hypothetical protein